MENQEMVMGKVMEKYFVKSVGTLTIMNDKYECWVKFYHEIKIDSGAKVLFSFLKISLVKYVF